MADGDADRERDRHLAERGYRVVRFWNNEVLANIEGVIAALEIALHAAPHPSPLTPALSPQAGRGSTAGRPQVQRQAVRFYVLRRPLVSKLMERLDRS